MVKYGDATDVKVSQAKVLLSNQRFFCVVWKATEHTNSISKFLII
jgi:hypothetical protein